MSIHIMGGAVFVSGNLREHLDPVIKQNQVAEFNIWVDPVAAQEVFTAASAGLKIVLTICLNPSFDLLPFNSEEIFGFSR